MSCATDARRRTRLTAYRGRSPAAATSPLRRSPGERCWLRPEIAIVPKLAPDTLVALFRYAYRLEDLELFDRVHLGEGGFSMADLVVAELHAEASALLRRGLRRTEVMGSPRGASRSTSSRVARC